MLHRVFKAFQYRDFRLMWIGACTSSIGTWMQILAQSWLVYRLSNSSFLLGLDAFLGGIPIFLFSLVGGVIADRMDRRKVLLGSQYVQMSCAFVLTLLVVLHVVHVWHILCLSFVSGLAQAFGGPAYQALIPTLVTKEDMPNAIALQTIQFNVARVVGPALGGLALEHLGEKWCFGLNGLSFLAPIISLTIVQPSFQPQKTAESIFAAMKQGFLFVRKQGAMEALMVLAFCMTALGIPVLTFLPVVAKKVFAGDARTFTLFLSVSGVGSIVGALTVAAFSNLKHRGRAALLMLVCLGAAISGFALSRALWLSCFMLFCSGFTLLVVFALVNSLVQIITTNEMRGRVMSVYNFAFRGGMPMGNLLAGRLVDQFTVAPVLAVNGLLLMGVALYFLTVHRRVATL
ncbi:MAG TPA: MFS transporter [Candidatus Acidoferrales bacterium]|nr:MFS transporter [Candidatus Acidoferrales bacterium]